MCTCVSVCACAWGKTVFLQHLFIRTLQVRVLCLLCICAPCAFSALRGRYRACIVSPGTGDTNGCEWLCRSWDLNLGSLEEQRVLSLAKPSLQPLNIVFIYLFTHLFMFFETGFLTEPRAHQLYPTGYPTNSKDSLIYSAQVLELQMHAPHGVCHGC